MSIDPSKLSEEGRKWLVHATVGMLVADGEISKTEMNRLKDALALLDDEMEVAIVLDQIRNLPMPDLEPITLDKKEAFEILKDLMQLAIVDGELSGDEAHFLEKVSSLLGFPKEVADKLNHMARKIVSENLRAQLNVKGKSVEVNCLRISKKGMVVISPANIPAETSVMASFYEKKTEDVGKPKMFMPLQARIQTIQKHPQEEGHYVSQIEFMEKLTINNGVRPLLQPKKYQDGVLKEIPHVHPLLKGYYAECRICGSREVVVWEPIEGKVNLEANMFGMNSIIKSNSGGGNPALYRVSICPGCMFSTPFSDYFYKPGNPVVPSALLGSRKFQSKWMSTVVKRKQELAYDFSWLEATQRTDEQGMMAWDFAIGCHEMLVDLSERVTAQQEWHMVICMMDKANLMSEQGKHRAANGYLQRVIVKIEYILENVVDQDQVDPLRLIGLLYLHEENEAKFEKTMKELVALRDRLSELPDAKAQARDALSCLQLADTHRNQYFKSKRQDYLIPVFEEAKEAQTEQQETAADDAEPEAKSAESEE